MARFPRWTLTGNATLALAVSAAFPGSAFAAEVARVQFATGQVNATGPDGRSRTLARGADVNEGDTVNTEQGRVQLKFNDGALVSLQPRTAFRIDEYAYRGAPDGTEKGFFSLLRGGLRTITGLIGRQNNDSYRVRTQTATIGIRGTEYIADVGNSLRVSVGGGRISLTNDAGTFVIEQGRTAYVADAKSLPVLEMQKPVLGPPGTSEGTDPPPSPPYVLVGENAGATTPGTATLTQVTPFAAAFTTGQYDSFNQTFVGTGAGTLNPSNQLIAFTGTNTVCCSGTLAFTPGSGTFAESSYDGVIGFARLANGMASLDGGEGGGAQNLTIGPASADGLHMAFGVPTSTPQVAALASSGTPTATYSMIGATSATASHLAGLGTVTPAQGTGQPILSVDFASGRVGTDFNVNFASAGTAYRVTTSGGLYNLSGSEISLRNASSAFAGFGVPTTGTGGACTSSSCSTDVRGFFAGANAERAGFTYRIEDNALEGTVHGAVAAGPGSFRSSLLTNVNAAAVFSGSGDGYHPPLFGGAEIFGGEGSSPGTAGLNASNHLVSYAGPYMQADGLNCCAFNNDGKAHVDPGTPIYAETGYDGTIGYGRLTNGTVVVDGGEGAGTTTLSATQGLHYVFGAVTPAMPASIATVTYSLLGATKATSDSGALGLGTFTGSLAVDFNTRRVGTDFSVAFPGTSYRVATTGGVTNVVASEMQFTLGNQGLVFGETLGSSNVTRNAAACASGCHADLLGFFGGNNAQRAGMGYRIYDHDSGDHVSGAAAFTASGTTPFLAGANIPLSYAGAHDFLPPSNSSDSYKHLNTTGSLDATTGGLVAINEGGTTTAATGMIAQTGRDDIIGWTRWTSGTLGGSGAHAGSVLSGNLSLHSVYGTPTSGADMTALQTQFGTSGLGVTYALIGATSPTSANGSTAPGNLVGGSLTAWFGSQNVDVSLGVAMPSSIYNVTASSLPITGSGFSGSTGNVSGSCSTCSANIQGFFAGAMAARAGLTYTISNSGTPVVNGAAAFGRTGTISP